MTKAIVVRTEKPAAAAAGEDLGRQISEGLAGRAADAVILFASTSHASVALLDALYRACAPKALVGCSTAGELTDVGPSDNSVVALALVSDTMALRPLRCSGLRANLAGSVESLAADLAVSDRRAQSLPFRTLLLLSDTLAGSAEEFLDRLTERTEGRYQVVGGGAGDDARFQATRLFFGRQVFDDGAVALEIRSLDPVGIGVAHGWTPSSPVLRVTAARGATVIALNGEPTIQVLATLASERGEHIDRDAPFPHFLHNVLGIETPTGCKLRVPLSVGPDGSVICAAEIPEGATIRTMRSSVRSSREASEIAARRARSTLHGDPSAVLFFDCAATRFRMGRDFGLSVDAIVRQFPGTPCVGFNTYGQFARVLGQFSGFHNCTAVVCALPD